MASEYKKRKVKSKYVCYGELKNKKSRCKGVAFYTSSLRKELDRDVEKILEEEEDGTVGRENS